MRASTCSAPKGKQAFTLLEVLVASAVLAMLMVLLAQMISATSDTIARTRRKINAAAQARLFLDRLGMDLSGLIARSDLPLEFINTTGNDSLRFYAEASGYSGNRRVSLLAYRVQENNPDRYYQAERGATGADWTSATSPPFAATTPAAANNADYEVLSAGVFRMEICYVQKSDGKLTHIPPPDIADISALVVAVATMDDESRALLSSSQLKNLSQALPNPTEGQSPLARWQDALRQSGFASSMPHKAVESIELHQRYYPLP